MWWSEFSIKDRNSKLKIEDAHWIIEKLENIDSSDYETDLVTLQRNLDKWIKYYSNYQEVRIDHTYDYHAKDQYQYFISGIRKETPLETQARIQVLKIKEEEQSQKEALKKEEELNKKREMLKKLKQELGEENE